MSQGKYSPFLTRAMIEAHRAPGALNFNAHGDIAPDFVKGEMEYDEKVHFGNYDKDGYDSYGYSAWNEDGSYAGIGSGIDRGGYTEMDYLGMSPDDFENVL